jgi:chromosome segregation ATPase
MVKVDELAMSIVNSDSKTALEFDRNTLEERISLLQELMLDQSERMTQQEQRIEELSRLMLQVTEILGKADAKIDGINQNLDMLGKATIATYRQLSKTSSGEELLALKAEQQALRKIADTVQRTLKIQSDNLVDHLDWKRTLAIVVTTAMLSSLFSLAIVKFVPNGWTNSTPTQSTPKKTIKPQKRS